MLIQIDGMNLENAIEVHFKMSLWSGEGKIEATDLGIKPGDVPPKEFTDMGRSKLIDKGALTKLKSLRDVTHRELRRFCESHMGGYVTDKSNKDAVLRLREAQHSKFEAYSEQLFGEFHEKVESLISKFPKYEKAIRAKLPSLDEIKAQTYFGLSVRHVAFFSDDEDAPENRDAIESAKGWVDQTYQAVNKLARERLKFLEGKKECRVRSLDKISVDIVVKLNSLGFAQQITPIKERVSSVMNNLSSNETIAGKDLSAVIGLLHFLADTPSMKTYSKAVQSGDVSVLDISEPFEQEKEIEASDLLTDCDESIPASDAQEQNPHRPAHVTSGGLWFN